VLTSEQHTQTWNCILVAQAVKPGQRVAVIGDGKFGLLIAQNLVVAGHEDVTHFGRHRSKLELVEGTTQELVTDDTAAKFTQVNMSDALLTSPSSTIRSALANWPSWSRGT
jgi:threonine dehydrogenase-like Zn-dependent dehydrogenase